MALDLTANMHEVATQAAVWVNDQVIKGLTFEWQRGWWRDSISQAEDANQLGVLFDCLGQVVMAWFDRSIPVEIETNGAGSCAMKCARGWKRLPKLV